MNNETSMLAIIIGGISGVVALIAQAVQIFINVRKQPVDIKKIEAEVTQIQGDTYRGIIDELQEQVTHLITTTNELNINFKVEQAKTAKLDARVKRLQTRQRHYEEYIDELIEQLRSHDIEPHPRPEELDG